MVCWQSSVQGAVGLNDDICLRVKSVLQTFADLRGLLGGLFPAQHGCSGRDVSIQMVNRVIPVQERTKPNLSPSVDPLTTFFSEGLWAKPKSQLSEVTFGRGGEQRDW